MPDIEGINNFYKDGEPFIGINLAANDTKTLKYWKDGQIAKAIFTAAAAARTSRLMLMGIG